MDQVMTDKIIKFEPSMLASNWGSLGGEAKRCEDAGFEFLHIDVMDGHFVPNLALGPDAVAAIRKAVPNLKLDVHLMVYSPEKFIEPFIEAGADEVTFQLEATEDVAHNLDYIRKCGKKAGLAIKPETSETLVLKYLDQVDTILVMTVEPGFGGQRFMEDMLYKVKFISEKASDEGFKIDVQVDGGVNSQTAKKCLEAGATRLVVGSDLFGKSDLKKAHKEYQDIVT